MPAVPPDDTAPARPDRTAARRQAGSPDADGTALSSALHRFRDGTDVGAFDRSHAGSAKWLSATTEPGPVRIPMGLGDADWPLAEGVADALCSRVKRGALGYTVVEERSRRALAGWFDTLHGHAPDPGTITFTPFGVKPTLRLLLEACRVRGREVVGLDPEYSGIAKVVAGAGATWVPAALRAGTSCFAPLVEAIRSRRPAAAVISSPHNPTGRVWPHAEITELAATCSALDCVLVTDEVHADLVLDDVDHTPGFALGAPSVVTLYSAGKTFGLTGLPCSALITGDEELGREFGRTLDAFGFYQGSALGPLAQDAALASPDHLHHVRDLVRENRQTILSALQDGPLRCTPPQAGFFLWIDCRGWRTTADETMHRVRHDLGIECFDGRKFGSRGEGFIRVNIGCAGGVARAAAREFRRGRFDAG